MTVEWLRYLSGHWQWTCPICHQSETYEDVRQAIRTGIAHQVVCDVA